MANNPQFSDVAAVAAMSARCALANGGTLAIYASPQPADANTAVTTQALLATLALSATAFGTPAASGGAGSRTVTATANAIAAGTAAATGTAAWFRVFEANGTTAVLDGSAGTSGCDLNLSTTSITAGGPVTVSALTVTQAE